MIDEQGVGRIAEAIAILVDADHLVAACTLLRLCEPRVRLELLNLCGSQRVARWRSSDDPQVRNPLDRALDAAAHHALSYGRYRELFCLLPFCSQEKTRTSVAAMFPSLTVELIGKLNGDEFVEAVRLTVERALTRDRAKCLAELHPLLALADELKTTHLAWTVTMMSVICPALDDLPPGVEDAGLTAFVAKLRAMARLPELSRELVNSLPPTARSEVLCVAVEQAAVEQAPDVCVNRLLGLAELSDRIGESDGIALRSHMMLVVGWLVVRWSEPTYQAHKSSLEAMLSRGGAVAPSRFSISIKTKTSYAIGKFAQALLGLADRFRTAVETGDLFTAALAIRECPYPEFCNTALRRLAEAALEKLAAAGDEGYLVPLQMAVVLVATGNAECSQLAAEILSTHIRTVQYQHLAIQRMMEEVEPEKRGVADGILTRVIDALPRLCSEEYSLELDIILMMEEGQGLVARAAVKGFLDGRWSSAIDGLLFDALSPRVDLGPALPAIQTTVQLEAGGKGRIEKVLGGPPLSDLRKLAVLGLYFIPSECRIRHVRPWARGWRFIWTLLVANNVFLEHDPKLLMGANAIDAAAADGLRGGADELLHRLPYPWAQAALDVMLQLEVNDKPLLSDGDLRNVLRAMLSDEQLGRDTLIWMGQVDDPARRVALHAAAAHALISLADDSSPCRFYPDRPANHIVGEMVRMFAFRVMHFLKIGKDVEAMMGEEAWRDISSKFPRSRTEVAPGVG